MSTLYLSNGSRWFRSCGVYDTPWSIVLNTTLPQYWVSFLWPFLAHTTDFLWGLAFFPWGEYAPGNVFSWVVLAMAELQQIQPLCYQNEGLVLFVSYSLLATATPTLETMERHVGISSFFSPLIVPLSWVNSWCYSIKCLHCLFLGTPTLRISYGVSWCSITADKTDTNTHCLYVHSVTDKAACYLLQDRHT
jgi:hypothetical protein